MFSDSNLTHVQPYRNMDMQSPDEINKSKTLFKKACLLLLPDFCLPVCHVNKDVQAMPCLLP